MFFGSLSFTGRPLSLFDDLTGCNYGDAVLCPVSCNFFRGGYYLHPRLPYSSEDYFFRNEKDDILVLLSGSVYNSSEMAVQYSCTDNIRGPELIATLFLNAGPGFVNRLNGDFACFIIRPDRKQAFLLRDHLGIRPLAWTMKEDTLVFSTDATELCRIVSNGAPADSEFHLGYFKYTDYRRTPDPTVRKVMPGHYVSFGPEGLKEIKYWFPEAIRTDRKMSYDRMLSDLGELLHDALSIRCDRRFVAGAHVSGGLDSGVVGVLSRREYFSQEAFYGFSWSPGDAEAEPGENDERVVGRRLCEEAGITPLFSGMNASKYERYIARSYFNHGYFIEDETSDMAAGLGVNLLFSGWGGDEFISTGHSGIDLDLLRGLRFRTFFSRNPVSEPRRFIRHFLFFVVYPALHILDPRAAGSFRRDVRYIKKEFKQNDREAIASFYFHGSRRRMHLNVFRFYNLPERCESWHLLGFRKGVEYRYPLLDRRIIEYMLKVPSELLCRTGQYRPLLREIGRGILPDDMLVNESKDDPVYWRYWGKLNRTAAISFMNETGRWSNNPDLRFVDFNLLNDDIRRYRKGLPVEQDDRLFRAVVFIKAIHEFSSKYHDARQ